MCLFSENLKYLIELACSTKGEEKILNPHFFFFGNLGVRKLFPEEGNEREVAMRAKHRGIYSDGEIRYCDCGLGRQRAYPHALISKRRIPSCCYQILVELQQ